MQQQLRGGDPTEKSPDYRHSEGGKRLSMSLIRLMRGERDIQRVSFCLALALIWSLVGLKQLQRRSERDQRGRKTRSHVLQTHSQGIKEVNKPRKN